MRARYLFTLLAAAVVVATCGEEGIGPPELGEVDVALELTLLRTLDPATEGTYEAWAIGSDGTTYSAGRFEFPSDGRVTVTSPIKNPQYFMVTVEPPGDDDNDPSVHKLLGGEFDGSSATLAIERYVTAGIPLEANAGTHVLFTPSDNAEQGYPSNEDAGIWVFNFGGDTLDGSFYIKLTPLTEGWSYEGWLVYDYGSPAAVWVSYGKFAPDNFKRVNSRDDTGLGPYSGRIDYETDLAFEVRMPGDDWISNPFDLPVPGGLTLPFDLNGEPALGIQSRWTHVITIEPWGPNREPELAPEARPFLVQPYRNPIGEEGAQARRTIEYHPELLPSGTATIIPR